MKNIEFEHENSNNYMVISSENNNENISYQQKMVEKNDIDGLLKMSVKVINNQKKYYYNITSRHKMTEVYEIKKLNYTDVKMIISSLCALIHQLKGYMLDIDCVLLESQYMYINMNTQVVEFTYYPEETFDFASSLKVLFEYILEKYDHNSDKIELMKVYNIYQKIVQGQYDINNLTQLCSDEMYNHSESQKEENIYIKNQADESIDNNIEYGCKSDNNFKNKDNKTIENNYSYGDSEKQNTSCNGTVIKGVMPETLDNECEVKSNVEGYVNTFATFLIILSAYVITGYFVKEISIIRLNIYISFAIAVALFSISMYLKKLVKGQRFSGKLVNKTIEQEYVIDNKIKSSNQDNFDNSMLNIKHNNQENTINDELAELAFDKKATNSKEVTKEFANGNTVLLSDYINNNNATNIKNKSRVVKLKGDNSEIEIKEFPFIIGSMKEYCMYVIENRLISRIHMSLLLKNEKLYLQDMNSTNGTFLNEKRLISGQEMMINNGDVIRLANQSYVVEIE